MPHNASLAAAFAAAPAVSSPFTFLATVEQWLLSAGQSFLATPEQRAAVKATVMGIYDSLAVTLGKTNVMAGALFGAFRSSVEAMVDGLLNTLSPPAPVPAPVVTPPAPQGAHAP